MTTNLAVDENGKLVAPNTSPFRAVREARFVWNYWFLEIPIAARFEFFQKKFAPFIELGVAPSMALEERSITFSESEKMVNDRDAIFDAIGIKSRKVHLVGLVSFGLNYNVSENFQLFGQPIFRYHFTPVADLPFNDRLYNLGIEFGLRKKIN